MVLGVEGPPEDRCERGAGGESRAVASPGEACCASFPDMTSAIIVRGGAQDLAVT